MPLPAGVVVTWILPSLAALLAAWAVQKSGGGGGSVGGPLKFVKRFLPSRSSLSAADDGPQYATWVIGDLHGDVECAKYWIQRTGLANDDLGEWIDPTSHLVFLGDYVDKGPTSRQVVELVKSLTEKFPQHVTAIMGNHEMELLLDRDPARWEQMGGVGFFGLAYSTVHPAEYLNYLPTKGDQEEEHDDELIVEALYNASAEVYARRLHQQMKVATEDQVGAEKSMLQFIPTENNLRARVASRLLEYQQAYLDAFRSGTELGTWLENRPVVAQINDTIFVHGGVSNYGSALLNQVGVNKTNQLLAENAHQEKLRSFITGTQIGQIIYDMLTFRGNHQESACPALLTNKLLPEGVTRLGVGHTPGQSVRFMCDDKFMALDSSLSRWFRNSGNLYCHGRHPVKAASTGQYVCNAMETKCQGQIIKMTANNGPVEVIQ